MRTIFLAAVLAVATALPAAAQRNVIAPYRFRPPDDHAVSPLDQQKALLYQNQLQNQLRVEQLHQIDRTAEGSRRLHATQHELNRVQGVLQPTPPAPPQRPSVSTFIPPNDRGPIGYDGPVVASGGHPQPTPAEIKEREAKLKRPPDRAPLELPPVYDLYGQRIE
jgi:hypothetical protein